jgi:channel protein (hemolysin III family)
MPPDRPVRSASAGGSPLPAPAVPELRIKPRLRGVLHQHAFFVSLASGTLLILLAVTGTYTPVGLLVLHGTLATVVLAVVWGGAVAGIVLELAWTTAPSWLGGTVYLTLGWGGGGSRAAAVRLFARLGGAGGLLLVAGGLAYSAGAAVYALRRPDPVPAVFGDHEVFHLLVIAGVAAHFLAISRYALPSG